ncbi:hypothetical protein GFS31_26050 [Leptolyngbya sp. BL0902]|uniref:hypothetical protein n=1 Tax=Leptolyngbya sp. BL0902 TaxID=1115757 RepID=UPI0018E78574|nr:hypothetical protein [Leptolyngbya sp. BL0902]QQE65913.1 hypothetical protein GFS31_26050 [Leptolyngbya sp. BL0902]
MTPTPSPKPEPTLQDVLDRLTTLSTELDEVKHSQDEMQHSLDEVIRSQDEMRRNQEQGQQWQDRTWDVVKWVGGISAGLAISASIALVGIVLRQLGQ